MGRALLDEQIACYRARASEYDEWFFREGPWDRGAPQREAWFAEVALVERALAAARPRGRVLELACGTGLWTRHLALHASELTAIDAAPEAPERNRERVASERVRYVQADLFAWQPRDRYDFVFFGFWLSHVPPERFSAFGATVRAALAPGVSVFFVDNGRPSLPAPEPVPDGEFVVERRLNDGRRFRIVKVFHEPAGLARRLAAQGFAGDVRETDRFFVYAGLSLAAG